MNKKHFKKSGTILAPQAEHSTGYSEYAEENESKSGSQPPKGVTSSQNSESSSGRWPSETSGNYGASEPGAFPENNAFKNRVRDAFYSQSHVYGPAERRSHESVENSDYADRSLRDSLQTSEPFGRESFKPIKRATASDKRLAHGLAFFGIALGVLEYTSPNSFARMIGVKQRPFLMRATGLREIGNGLGILSSRRPKNWLLGRIAGDVADLTLLARATSVENPYRKRAIAAFVATMGVTALDLFCAARFGIGGDKAKQNGVHVKRSIVINRSPAEVYRFWRNLENLPRVMKHLESVRIVDETHSRWIAKGPAGSVIEWDAEITLDRPNELLVWRSMEHADVDQAGCVRFVGVPNGHGTEVIVDLHYNPPAGSFGAAIAWILGEEPSLQMRGDLRRLKQILEKPEALMDSGESAHPQEPRQTWYEYFTHKLSHLVH